MRSRTVDAAGTPLRVHALATFAARVPRAEVVRIERARHSLLEDAPEAVARELGRWLARLYA